MTNAAFFENGGAGDRVPLLCVRIKRKGRGEKQTDGKKTIRHGILTRSIAIPAATAPSGEPQQREG
jgi:hypothetical protein